MKLEEVSMEENLLTSNSTEVGGNCDGSSSNGIRWTLMECLWKQLEVCDTSWKQVDVF